MCQELKYSLNMHPLNPPYKVTQYAGAITIPLLQTREERYRELAQSQSATMGRGLMSEPMLFPIPVPHLSLSLGNLPKGMWLCLIISSSATHIYLRRECDLQIMLA